MVERRSCEQTIEIRKLRQPRSSDRILDTTSFKPARSLQFRNVDESWRGDLELDGRLGFLQLAVNSEIERGEVTVSLGRLETDPDRPDFLEFERWLAPNKRSFVPRDSSIVVVLLLHVDSSFVDRNQQSRG